MQEIKNEYRCVIDGIHYDSVEAVAAHLRMQHDIKNYKLFVARQRPW